jgi:lipopolysaccharide export system permease protein
MIRIRTLDRYVVREFARLFSLAASGAPLLFILGDVMDNLDKHIARGIGAPQVALSYLYQLPLFVLYSLPIAALIAAVFTVGNMTRHSEVSAAKAGGVSFFRLFATLPVLGLLLTVAGLGLSELVPVTNRLREETLGIRSRTRAERSHFIYRGEDGRAYAIRQLTVGSRLIDGIAMEREGDEPEIPSEHASAALARYEPANGWTLVSGHLRLFMGPEIERTFEFDSLRIPSFHETPEQLLAVQKDPENMGYAELGRFIEINQRSGGRPLKLIVARAQKIAIPVATLVSILFAMPLATSSRRGGSAYGMGISLAITILYLMLFKVTGAMGASGALPGVAAAWIPNAAFALAAVALLIRVRS